MKYDREYKIDVDGVGTVHVGIDEKNNWYVELKGGTWKPIQISDRPVWIDNRKWSRIPEIFGIDESVWNTIRGEVQLAEDQRDNGEEEDPNQETYDPEIIKKAKEIFETEDVISLLMTQYHKNHRGDDMIGLGWFCSFASGQSVMSEGIQPTAHSEDPGMGKTDSAKAAFHCIHTRRDLETSVSAMSLYRDTSLKPGDIIFSDDVEWSTGLVTTVKRAMSNFQRETHHTTLDTNNELAKFSLPPRLLWWFTSVESSAVDQIVDRQFLFDVDDSEKHHEKVNVDIKHRRSSGSRKFEANNDVLITRCITNFIRKNGPYKVDIPFSDFIVWKLPKGHRDLNRFLDLIDAFAILRFNHRNPKKHKDAPTEITASLEDYKMAKKVFASRQKNIRTHLTNSETRLLVAMIDRGEWTQADLVERTGMKQSTVSKRLGSLMEKSNYVKQWKAGGEKLYSVTDQVDISIFANEIVSLNLKTGVTFLGTDYENIYSTLFHTYSTLIPLSIPTQIDKSRRNMEYLFQNSETPPEKKNNCLKNGESLDKKEKFSFGGVGGKSGINSQNQQQEAQLGWNKSGISMEYDRNNGGITATGGTIDILEYLSELERTCKALRISEIMDQYHVDEYEFCEILYDRGWREGPDQGIWTPKSRMEF